MATSNTSGSNDKAATTAGARKGAATRKAPARGASPTQEGAAGRGAGAAKSTAKKATGGAARKAPAGGTGDGSANVQPRGAAPAKRAGGAARKTAGGEDRRRQLREFCATRLGGWSHDEWEGLIDDLERNGQKVSDRDALGMELERERLAMMLEKVPGVSTQKAKSLVSRFNRLWDMRQADADDIAAAGKLPRPLAERIVEAIR